MATVTPHAVSETELVAVFLDIGRQGDAIVVLLPGGGRAILVDCAEGAAPAMVDFLEKSQIETLELVVVTHSDLDHMGDVVRVIENFSGNVKLLVVRADRQMTGDRSRDGQFRRRLQEIAHLLRTRIDALSPEAGSSLLFGGTTVRFLHPAPADALEALARGLRNDASIVLQLEYQGRRILLGADVQGIGWKWMRDRGTDLKSDIFKYPHHGAWFEDGVSPEDVMDLVDPELVIIPAGPNSYGHPSPKTLHLLSSRGERMRLVCTQVAKCCHPSPGDVRSQALQILSQENIIVLGSRSETSCPCAGTVIVKISEAQLRVVPPNDTHDRVVALLSTPQCRNGHENQQQPDAPGVEPLSCMPVDSY